MSTEKPVVYQVKTGTAKRAQALCRCEYRNGTLYIVVIKPPTFSIGFKITVGAEDDPEQPMPVAAPLADT